MGNESNKWNRIMVAAMAVPGIKVNRASFYKKNFLTVTLTKTL